MASLELTDIGMSESNETLENNKGSHASTEESLPKLRRSTRIIHPVGLSEKVIRKPKSHKDSEKSIQNYYLSKHIKRTSSTLETIFEEPINENNQTCYMSIRKFKRVLNFADKNSKSKLKKRSMKAKKNSSKQKLKVKKIAQEVLLKKLASLEEDEGMASS